ncbi:MAG: hypothetical protein QM487_10710 [Candidatus Marithrix sp.]
MTDQETGLAYVEYNKKYREDILGSTLIAKIQNRSIISGVIWYEIYLLTDPGGHAIEPLKMNIRSDQWLDNRPRLEIDNPSIYHFTKSNTKKLTASNYVYSDNSQKPLETTTITAWPSGVEGLYLPSGNFKSYKTSNKQIIYNLELGNPFIIQDYAHVESITSASMSSNVIIDKLLINSKLLETVDLTGVTTLWNIVFYRVFNERVVDEDWLLELIRKYLLNYKKGDIKDTISLRPLNEPFINTLFMALGYDSLLNPENSQRSMSVIFNTDEIVNFKGAHFKHH